MVNIIQTSIILMYPVSGKVAEIPMKLNENNNLLF